ncbi:MAG TPA: winged helix DNA-binding domain-containing protein [Chloroflexia bacterium]|nr:winged helix DNA-binding domain-containing protein [Chloroflexia bacterium]
MAVKSLTWQQVNAWRVSQHCLSTRLKRADYVKAVERTGGIQAQVMSAAELALWARVDGLTPKDVQSALWQDRTLVKTWAMRGTLHLLSADELPLFIAARSMHDDRDWLKYFTYYGITEPQYEAFIAAVPQVLGSEPVTREQLATAVSRHIGVPELGKLLLSSSWGSLWKPSAFRGDLCFGPNQGRNVTFVNPRQWIGKWQPVEPHLALQEIARRYLRAYGPSTPHDFARWWDGGSRLVPTRKLFQSIEDELEAVDVDGRHAFALRTTLEQMEGMQRLETSGVVRLLPLFDAYTLGLERDLEQLLPRAYKSRVFRPQGWISAVVLVDGRMKGVWGYKIRGSQTTVKVQMFSSPTTSVKKGIEAEAERLNAFLNTKVVLEFEE